MTGAVTYTALRDVIAGHAANEEYGLDLMVTALDYARRVGKEQQVSLSDKAETLWYFGKDEYTVTCLILGSSALAAVKEFLHSTEGGESFGFSPYSTAALMEDAFTARRPESDYQLQRVTNLGTADDAFEVTFTVREA